MRYGTAIIIEGSVSCSDLGGYTSESAILSLNPPKEIFIDTYSLKNN